MSMDDAFAKLGSALQTQLDESNHFVDRLRAMMDPDCTQGDVPIETIVKTTADMLGKVPLNDRDAGWKDLDEMVTKATKLVMELSESWDVPDVYGGYKNIPDPKPKYTLPDGSRSLEGHLAAYAMTLAKSDADLAKRKAKKEAFVERMRRGREKKKKEAAEAAVAVPKPPARRHKRRSA